MWRHVPQGCCQGAVAGKIILCPRGAGREQHPVTLGRNRASGDGSLGRAIPSPAPTTAGAPLCTIPTFYKALGRRRRPDMTTTTSVGKFDRVGEAVARDDVEVSVRRSLLQIYVVNRAVLDRGPGGVEAFVQPSIDARTPTPARASGSCLSWTGRASTDLPGTSRIKSPCTGCVSRATAWRATVTPARATAPARSSARPSTAMRLPQPQQVGIGHGLQLQVRRGVEE